jgi:two-component system OmpR family response regulator
MQILPSILLVEDDRNIAGALAQALRSSYEVDIATSGQLAIYKNETGRYDIIILDLNLPDMSGITVCQELRDRGQTAPILILTAEANVMTKISLLDAGANDYLTKPVSLGELKARLRVLFRSQLPTHITSGKLTAGDVLLDRLTHSVSRGGLPIKLRRKEFALLECLMEHAGSVVSRQTLSSHAWQGDDLWTNTVDVHIKYLRDKIDRPFDQPIIQTVHGLGYKLNVAKTASKETDNAKTTS